MPPSLTRSSRFGGLVLRCGDGPGGRQDGLGAAKRPESRPEWPLGKRAPPGGHLAPKTPKRDDLLRWYIGFIHSMPTCNWAVEDAAEGGTRPFYAWTS